MIIGHNNLLKLFPNFAEDVQENGIDLRVGKIEAIQKDEKIIGCVNDEKYKPNYFPIKLINDEYYKLYPQNFYFITIDRPIHIPKGYIQQYYLRSTFSRCGLILTDAIGDSDFNGTLRVGVYNSSPLPIFMSKNERIIQAVTIKTDGSETSYNGDYQEDKFYE